MYSQEKYSALYSRILSGDKLASKEFIKRHKEKDCILNPIIGNANNTLFQLIVRYNLTNIAIEFMALGVQVNTQDRFGNTPLHEAAKNGNKLLVEQLLEKGANPFTHDVNRITAWMLAERNGHRELASRLHVSFILNYPNLLFPSNNGPVQKNEDQDKPLDLSKTGPYATNVEPLFFTKVIRSEEAEEIVVEIDPRNISFNCKA